MAHPTFHAAAGMVLGMAVGGIHWWQTRRAKRSMSHRMGIWLLWAWGAACFALLPAFLRLLGFPQSWTNGWWMNVFVGYPLLNRMGRHTGALIGGAFLALSLAIQYIALLAALVGVRRRRRTVKPATECIR